MFIVIGIDLVKRVATRNYCGEANCKNIEELVEQKCATTSLYYWISTYNDDDKFVDNARILHIVGNSNIERRNKLFNSYISTNSCLKYVVLHKAVPDSMYRNCRNTLQISFHSLLIFIIILKQ